VPRPAATGNGDPSEDGGSAAPPRLTLGQRVLTSLPNLQRTAAGGRRSPAAAAGPAKNEAATTEPAVSTPAAPTPRRSAGASGMTAEELSRLIKRIDDREQLLAYAGAGFGVIVGVALTVATVHLNPPVHHKGHADPGWIWFDGGVRVVLAGVVALAAWWRRRSFVAFSLLFLGVALASLFALPFWGLGFYLIFRVLKWQRELAALTGTTRPAVAASRGRQAAEARRAARTEKVSARTAGRRRGSKAPEPDTPAPSKRYTPPRTVRPRPPGS